MAEDTCEHLRERRYGSTAMIGEHLELRPCVAMDPNRRDVLEADRLGYNIDDIIASPFNFSLARRSSNSSVSMSISDRATCLRSHQKERPECLVAPRLQQR